MRTVLVNNHEYSFLLDHGGDALIATFASLRSGKKEIVLRPGPRAGLIGLLKSEAGLSRTTIEKYVPQLIELDLVEVHENGNVAIRGRKWTRRNLPFQPRYKLIPIQVGPKFTDTKLSAAFVRVHSNIMKQKSQIAKKAERIQLLQQHEQGLTKSQNDLRVANNLVKKGTTVRSLKDCLRSNSTICNLGFHRIIKCTENTEKLNKSGGNYFKTRLMEKGLIVQNRNVRKAHDLKNEGLATFLNENSTSGGFFLGTSGVFFEDSPTIDLYNVAIVGSKKKRVEK